MVRLFWLVALLIALANCGQPLQVAPSPRATRLPVAEATRPVGAGPRRTARPVEATVAPAEAPTAQHLTPAPPTSPTPGVTIVPQPAATVTAEQRWRSQQAQRQVLDPPQIYVATSPIPLLWYDPATGQSVEIGLLRGEFPVQAQFILQEGGQQALEVPYKINADFGLTAISDALRQRMQASGYQEWVEAYIVQTDAVQPKGP